MRGGEARSSRAPLGGEPREGRGGRGACEGLAKGVLEMAAETAGLRIIESVERMSRNMGGLFK